MHWNGQRRFEWSGCVSSYHLVADFCEHRHQTTCYKSKHYLNVPSTNQLHKKDASQVQVA
jgi:hypothetical protein